MSIFKKKTDEALTKEFVSYQKEKAKETLYQGAEVRMPIYKVLKVSDLKIADYQRELNYRRVRKYAKEFDWDVFGIIMVSYRDGNFYVFDGQHRIELLKMVGIESVLCQIIEGLTYEEEAGKFVKLNSERGGLSSNEKFHGRVEMEDEVAINIVKLLHELGLSYARKSGIKLNNVVSAVACLENIYKSKGGKHLKRTLGIIKDVWYGDAYSLSRDIIAGVSTFLAESRGVKDDVLISALEKHTTQDIILRALVAAGTNNISGFNSKNRAPHVARVIREFYTEEKKLMKDANTVNKAIA